jgi:hypothetical protein
VFALTTWTSDKTKKKGDAGPCFFLCFSDENKNEVLLFEYRRLLPIATALDIFAVVVVIRQADRQSIYESKSTSGISLSLSLSLSLSFFFSTTSVGMRVCVQVCGEKKNRSDN